MIGQKHFFHNRIQTIWTESVRFHGKACASLALGVRVCDTALSHLGLEKAEPDRLVCVCENDGCCIDAIQIGLHCTAGRKRLLFYKTGRYTFTVYDPTGDGSIRILTRPEIASRIPVMKPEEILAAEEAQLFSFEPAHPLTQRVQDKVRMACGAPKEDVPPRDPGVQDGLDPFRKFDLPGSASTRTPRRFR